MSQTVGAWNLRGVSPEARAAARDSAAEAGVPLGNWLSQLIREMDAEELSARETGGGLNSVINEAPRLSSIERAMLRGNGTASGFGSA